MKCQVLFFFGGGKIKKSIISLSSAELAKRVVKVKLLALYLKFEHGQF